MPLLSESRYLWTKAWLNNSAGQVIGDMPTVEEELSSAAERVGDVDQVGTSLRREGLRRRVAGAREQEVVLRAGGAQLVDNVLQRSSPLRDVEVVRLIHETANNLRQRRADDRRNAMTAHKIMRSLEPYSEASWVQMDAYWSFVGPPWPMISPFQRA